MSRLNQYKERLDKFLHQENAFTNVLAVVEEKTKVKRLNIFLGKCLLLQKPQKGNYDVWLILDLFDFLGVVVLFSLYLIFGYGTALIVNALGAVYPAYCS